MDRELKTKREFKKSSAKLGRHVKTKRVQRRAAFCGGLIILVVIVALGVPNLLAGEQVFAMAVWGGGSTTELSVHNPNSSTAPVTIAHYLQDGTLAQSQSLDIGPGATGVVRKGGADGAVQPGWIHVSSPAVVLTREIFDLSVGGRKLPVIGVLPGTSSRRITLFGYRASGLDTGIAITYPGAEGPATIQVKARASNGSVIATAPSTLPPHGARSVYISELFPDLPDSFEGVIEIESPKPVAAVTLLQDSAANLTTVGALAWEEGQAVIGNCESIQEAIDALPETGGRVFIPAGRYPCKTALIVNKDNVWVGGVAGATHLELDAGANSPLLVLGATATPPPVTRGIRVSNLTLSGRRGQQTSECWGGPCDSGGLSYIRNNGITIRGVEDTLVENVTVRSCRSGGIVAERGCRRLTLRQIEAYDNEFDGIAAYNTTNSVIDGVFTHDNLYGGLSFDLSFDANIISNTTITNNGKVGIFMRDSRNNLFQGLQVSKCGEHGIFLAQPPGFPAGAVTGNTFIGCQIHDCVGAGVRVNDSTCVNNQFVGCQLSGNAGGCISEASPGLASQSGVICR